MPGYAGGTAAADLTRLRRMVAESGTATYTDSLLVDAISRYPLPDISGEWPYLTSGSANTDWSSTYDLANAAADIWEEKGAAIADQFDFTADGATFHREQKVKSYTALARHWRSRRAIGSHDLIVYPAPTLGAEWIANINDPYE